MRKVRVAVIGAGGIGGAHLNAYREVADLCEIVGVADVNLSAAQERAANFGGAAFADYTQLLEQVQPAAISICTPPNLHLPIAQAAAERGIAILCEKPPARTLVETQSLVAAAAAGGTLLQFAFCHRFHQPVQQAQTLIATGRLGKVVQIYNRFGFRFARAGHSWFTEAPIAGGGILIDTLVHSVDIFRALAGEVKSVAASISTTLETVQVEDSASILLTSERNVIGALTCSWVTPVSEAEVRIYGTEGEAVIDYGQNGGLRYRLADEAEWTQLPFDQPNRFQQQARAFLQAVTNATMPVVTGQDGLAVMAVIDAAYQSARTHSQSIRL
jgi:UDP-N-acetylglucosamine 3-dehydrogenase